MPSHHALWWFGVLLESVGAAGSAAGKLMWRRAATSSFPARWYVAGAAFSMFLYPMLDTVAYAFTSQQILSASSGYIMCFNVLGATLCLRETLTVSRATGVVVIVAGTAMSVALGKHFEYDQSPADYYSLLDQPSARVFYCAMLAWLVVATWLLLSRHGSALLEHSPNELRAMLIACIGGSIAGNMWVTKVAMELLGCVLDREQPDCPLGLLPFLVITLL